MSLKDLINTEFHAPDTGAPNGGNEKPKGKVKSKKTIRKIIVTMLLALTIGGLAWGAKDFMDYKNLNPDGNFGSYISYTFNGAQDAEHFFKNMSETENIFEGTTKAEYEAYYAQMSKRIVKRYFEEEVGNVPSDFDEFKIEYMTNTKDGLKLYMTACNSNGDGSSPIWKATADYVSSEDVMKTLDTVKDYDIIRHLDYLTDNIAPTNKTMLKIQKALDDYSSTKINDIIKNNSRTINNYMMGEVYGVWEVDENTKTAKALWSTNQGLHTIFTIDLDENVILKNSDVFRAWRFDTTSSNVDTDETQANKDQAHLFQNKMKNANDFENTNTFEQ